MSPEPKKVIFAQEYSKQLFRIKCGNNCGKKKKKRQHKHRMVTVKQIE